jgi:hypothetical protein
MNEKLRIRREEADTQIMDPRLREDDIKQKFKADSL